MEVAKLALIIVIPIREKLPGNFLLDRERHRHNTRQRPNQRFHAVN